LIGWIFAEVEPAGVFLVVASNEEGAGKADEQGS